MIKIDGNFAFDLKIGKKQNFLNYDDLLYFSVYEDAGCVLPTFDLEFKFMDEEIKNYLNLNNVLEISFGSDFDTMETLSMSIYEKNIVRYKQTYWKASISGMFSAIPFLDEVDSSSHEGNALNVLRKVSSKWFSFETNIEPTTDMGTQVWLRTAQSFRDFMTDVWLHSDLKDSFTGMAINRKGKMKLVDMKKLFSKPSDWVISYDDPTASNQIVMSGIPEIANDTSTVNTLIQNKQNQIYNMDSHKMEYYKYERSTLLANTTSLDEVDLATSSSTNYITNSNVHPKYWQSYVNNINSLVFFSGVTAIVSFIGQYHENLEPLQTVTLLDVSSGNKKMTEGTYSGKYVIAKVVRTIDMLNKNLQTHLVLNRESFNDVKNVNKEKEMSDVDTTQDKQEERARARVHNVMSGVSRSLGGRSILMTLPNLTLKGYATNQLSYLKSLMYSNVYGIVINTLYSLGMSKIQYTLSFLRALYQYKVMYSNWTNVNNSTVASLTTSASIAPLIAGGSISVPNVTVPAMADFNDGGVSGNTTLAKNTGSTQVSASATGSNDSGTWSGDNIANNTSSNVVTAKLTEDEWSASVFSWYVTGAIDVDNINTGYPELDSAILETLSYILTNGIKQETATEMHTRFWSTSKPSYVDDIYVNPSMSSYSSPIGAVTGSGGETQPYYLAFGKYNTLAKCWLSTSVTNAYTKYTPEGVLSSGSYVFSFKTPDASGASYLPKQVSIYAVKGDGSEELVKTFSNMPKTPNMKYTTPVVYMESDFVSVKFKLDSTYSTGATAIGCCEVRKLDTIFDNSDIKGFYTEEKAVKEYRKILTLSGDNVCVLLPRSSGVGTMYINNELVEDCMIFERIIKIGSSYKDYYLYKTRETRSGSFVIEVRFS